MKRTLVIGGLMAVAGFAAGMYAASTISLPVSEGPHSTTAASSEMNVGSNIPELIDIVWGPVTDPSNRTPDCNSDRRFTFWQHDNSLYLELPFAGAAFRLDRVEEVAENHWTLHADAAGHPMNGFELTMVEPGYLDVPQMRPHRHFARCG
ncbi:hypothetical protein [Tepidicaulis sp.]|uniref:hypothetical protein n=1 Tax=Tepidicaulis sp. TaxID=1920809 RepID=UPI003B5A9B2C